MINMSIIKPFIIGSIVVACGQNEAEISIDGQAFQIPKEYLVESYHSSGGRDEGVGIIALSFNNDKEFSKYLSPNGWLPASSVTADLYSRKGNRLSGLSPDFKNLEKISFSDKKVVEFDSIYRVFTNNSRTKWKTFPKKNSEIYSDGARAKWIANCIPLGGVKSSLKSHESMEIPTSCKINIEYRGLVIRLKTSEENFVDNISRITKLVLSRLDSWRVK